jgi:two-component system, sensor histidine kinase and response regulator
LQRTVNCLIVDDLPENLLALSALLESDTVRVLQADSAREALELLLQHEVALAIFDVQMPEIDGFELAELVRGSERTRDIPIIFVTAGAPDERWRFRGYQSGAVDFLYKPISPQLLTSKAQVFFDLYRHRQVLREQLARNTEMLHGYELFAAMLGHDLRTPLGAVLFSAELLQRQVTEEAHRKAAARIIESGGRMGRMIEEMLDLARARLMGGIAVEPEATNMERLVRLGADEHRVSDSDRPIVLSAEGNTDGRWDSVRLAQLVSNLIGNALQHGQPGELRIHVDGRGEAEVRVSFSNAGGIPADLVANLFDPFHVRKRRGGRSQNLGLGLYIAKQIAISHGGDLAVRADDPERTVFELVLPRAVRKAT